MTKKKEDIVITPRTDNQYNAIRSSADFVVLTGGTGGGKEQPISCNVLTINGWKLLGDIRIGDRLIAPLNDEESVVTGIYPQGIKKTYELTTCDGRKTRCGINHLWNIICDSRMDRIIMTTKEIKFLLKKKHSIYLPTATGGKDKYEHRDFCKYIKIKSIEYIGKEDCKCIMVSNKDHLYITDDYIVTHNTVALYYAPIEYLISNPGAKIVCFMRNVSDFWGVGKVSDTIKQLYPLVDRSIKRQPGDPIGDLIHNQVDMGVNFYNNSGIKFQQLDNESRIVIDKIAKGIQTKKLIFDECNKFKWETITTFQTRLRANNDGNAQIYLAQNPERLCPLRTLCGDGEHGGGWIAENGEPIKEMDGRLMYFFMHNGIVDETYFGKTKDEVYQKCKNIIDEKLEKNKDMTYEDFILSMVFYTFDVRDNKEMLMQNKHYRALTANSATAQSSHDNNWNYSIYDVQEEEDTELGGELRPEHIESMFRMPMEYIRKTERITVDLAFSGLDNFVIMHWFGFHCDDIMFCEKNSFAQAVEMILDFMKKHNCEEKNLIIDVQGDAAMKEVFNLNKKSGGIGATQSLGVGGYAFSGAISATGKSRMSFERFKDEAAYLAVNMIKAGLITMDPKLKDKRYTHQKLKREGATTICKQMVFESKAFVFDKNPSGRIRFMAKDRQHFSLKGFSPDLLDNVIMLCGTSYSICYEALARITGTTKTKVGASDIMNYINANNNNNMINNVKKEMTVNSDKILNILRNI